MIIGLTGLYCAGKNHIGLLLEKRGIPVLDVDKLGYKVIDSETEKIAARFGKEILDSVGKINRKHLGKLVFGRPGELADLESIVHPGANRLTEEWIAGKNADEIPGLEKGSCVINAALLQKSSVFEKLDAIIVVYAPFPVRFFRALKRDNCSPWELFRRFLCQKDFPNYQKSAHKDELTGKSPAQLFFPEADIYTIRNSGFYGSPRVLEKQVEAILKGLRKGI